MQQCEPQPLHPGRVLILGHDARVLLAIVRSLGRQGHACEIATASPLPTVRASRYCRAVHAINLDDPGWLDRLRELHAGGHYTLIIPASESATLKFSLRRAEIADLPVLLTNQEALDVGLDKIALHQLAAHLALPTPETLSVSSYDEAKDFAERHGYPLYLKPTSSIDGRHHADKRFARRITSDDQLQSAMESHEVRTGEWLVQAEVAGEGVGVEFLAEAGDIVFAFQHRRLHETRGHGSTYRCSETLDPELLAATQRLIAEVGYCGVGMCEFRVERDRGRWRLIELNPRFWGSLPLAIAAGADFPALAYQLATAASCRPPHGYRVGLRCRSLRNDLRWQWAWLRQKLGGVRDRADGWSPNERSLPQLAADQVRLLCGADATDSFSWDDPMPWIRECRDLLGDLPGKMLRKLRRAFAHEPAPLTARRERGAW